MKNNPYQLSLSLISTNLSDINQSMFNGLKKNINSLHFDVMDNHFVPRLGLYPELIGEIKKYTSLPIDVHLMVERPENIISQFIELKPNSITFHAESTHHLHWFLQLIKNHGIRTGIALTPSTDPSVLKYLLDNIDVITIMAINPGIPRHTFIPQTHKKIQDTKALIGNRKIDILVDGGINIDTALESLKNGANILVCGSSVIYQEKFGDSIANRLRKFHALIDSNIEK